MNFTVSFKHLYNDWYVGELYGSFFKHLKEKYKHFSFNYEDIQKLGERFGFQSEYNNSVPSPFSPYNLIIINESRKKILIHSLQDYASLMISELNKLTNYFDTFDFYCCSNLTPEILNTSVAKNIHVHPSFYCLENLTDYSYIEKYKNNDKLDTRPFFAGLVYGSREVFKNALKQAPSFNFLDKRESSSYLTKQQYYEFLSHCQYGMSFNGAAKICYRDLEYFGLGVLNLREQLNVCTVEPLIQGVHYINFFDEDVKKAAQTHTNDEQLIRLLEEKIHTLSSNGTKEVVTQNANTWYQNNCTSESHIKWLDIFFNSVNV